MKLHFFLFLALCFFVAPTCAQTYWGDIINSVDLEKVDLSRPVGVYKKLLEWSQPQFEGEKKSFQCLIFKVPRDKEKAELSIYSYHKKGCPIGSHFQIQRLIRSDVDIKFKDQSDFTGYRLQIIAGAELINLNFPQGKKNKRWKSLIFKDESVEPKESRDLKEGDYCLKWNKNCEQEIEYSCDQCPDGKWMETMNYKECPSKVSAICGGQSCGGKNQPACLKMVSLKYPLTCEEALNFVVCGPLFVPNCEGTGEIICR